MDCAFPNFQTIRHLVKLKLLLRVNAIVGSVMSLDFFVLENSESFCLHHHHFSAGK
jgi:hypothetical protein